MSFSKSPPLTAQSISILTTGRGLGLLLSFKRLLSGPIFLVDQTRTKLETKNKK
jgi:hypothetical protein